MRIRLRLAGTLLSFAYARGEPHESQQWLESALAASGTAAVLIVGAAAAVAVLPPR